MQMAVLEEAFRHTYGYAPTFLARAPGRVNLIGEHTDYNDGLVLPMAIDREAVVVGAPRDDNVVNLFSLHYNEKLSFDLGTIARRQEHHWSHYVLGVADALLRAGHTLKGFDGVLGSDVPIGSGLSSSAAVELATLMAFAAATPSLQLSPLDAARLAQRAENCFVGVQCGLMDQLIAALGRAGHALLIDCRTLAHQPVPLPEGYTVVIIDTAAPRALASSAYNERRAQCEQAARLLGVPALRDVSPEELARRQTELPPLLARRARHVVRENQRVLQAVEALRAGDVAELGALMNQSHDSLRDDYEVSSPALDAAVEIARATDGVLGARMTGAGFGGCAIALAAQACVPALTTNLLAHYPKRTGLTPRLYPCSASDGATWHRLDDRLRQHSLHPC